MKIVVIMDEYKFFKCDCNDTHGVLLTLYDFEGMEKDIAITLLDESYNSYTSSLKYRLKTIWQAIIGKLYTDQVILDRVTALKMKEQIEEWLK